jgi:predicted nuclease of predicted toxin-antitoxin system
MMKIVADESVDFMIVTTLRQNNVEVLSIQQSYQGIDDEIVLEVAVKNKTLLLTEDKDFGELVFRLKREHFGVILVRLDGYLSQDKAKIVAESILENYSEMLLSFSVIDKTQTRIRKLNKI